MLPLHQVAFLLKTIEGDSNAQERVQRLPWSASTSQLSSPETHPCNTSAGGETTINHCHNNMTYCDDINIYKSVFSSVFPLLPLTLLALHPAALPVPVDKKHIWKIFLSLFKGCWRYIAGSHQVAKKSWNKNKIFKKL